MDACSCINLIDMIPLEVEDDENVSSNNNSNALTILAFPDDNLYHSKCGKKVFGSKADTLSKLFQTNSQKTVIILVASFVVPWLTVIAIQSILFNYFWNISKVLDTIHDILYVSESIIPMIGQLLFILSFNLQLVKYQLSQFEVLYKFYLLITCAVSLFFVKSLFHGSKSWNEVENIICATFSLIVVALAVIIATCADAAKTHYSSKIFVSIIAIFALISAEIEFLMVRWSSKDFYQIIVFGITLNGYDILRHCIETLIVFFIKELVIQIYIYSFQKQYTKAAVIKSNVIIDWYDKRNININDNRKSLLDYNWNDESYSTPNSYNHNNNSDIDIHSNSDQNFHADINSDADTDRQLQQKLPIVVYMEQDFYHTDCMITRMKMFGLEKSFADRLSGVFQSKKIVGVACFVFSVYATLVIVAVANNKNAFLHYTEPDTNTLQDICITVRVILLIIFEVLVIFSFNVKLFKLQFENFETIYKLSNALIIIICEMMYIGNDSDYKNASSDGQRMLIVRNILYFICSFIAVTGVSCIDAWCINAIYKKIFLICLVTGLVYWFMITVHQRTYQDYPYLNPKINIYYYQRSAFATLIVFLLKNLLLLIYYSCRKTHHITTQTMTKKSERAVSPFDNPIILWING